MKLDALLVENFAGVYLSGGYDGAAPTPAFHREGWGLYCSDEKFVALAAPRGHAKSTAFTHDFGLAAVCFRFESHVMIVGSTEEMAMGQLGDMARELRENEELRRDFGILKLETDSKAEVIVLCDDGYRFRLIARGVEQRVRGMKWNGRRPGLILLDDVEEDEQVANADRRKKLSRWINRALIPAGRRGCKLRWHGTLLHQDSMLARLMRSSVWVHRLYKAHSSFDDFSDILWPEKFTEAELRVVRQTFIEDMDGAGYSQEYLNDPRDDETNYLKRDWFDPMTDQDRDADGIFGVGVDFAISKKNKANRTSITTGKMDAQNTLHFVGQTVGRWDSLEIIDELFSVNQRWRPDYFWVEDGQIWKALWPMIRKEMQRRAARGESGSWINFIPRTPVTDKSSRGRSLQKRMKGGGTRWDKEADWFIPMQEELLGFSEEAEAALDDQFDSAALLSLGFDDVAEVEPEDLIEDAEWEMIANDPRRLQGRNATTGY